MSWIPNQKEINAVLSLKASERYEYWIKKVADQEEVWSLWQVGGWALAGGDAERQFVPVWPHSEYAALCAGGVWAGYQPKAIAVAAWLDRWIPGMERDQRLVAVFPTPNDMGVAIDPRQLERDLREEMANYE